MANDVNGTLILLAIGPGMAHTVGAHWHRVPSGHVAGWWLRHRIPVSRTNRTLRVSAGETVTVLPGSLEYSPSALARIR